MTTCDFTDMSAAEENFQTSSVERALKRSRTKNRLYKRDGEELGAARCG